MLGHYSTLIIDEINLRSIYKNRISENHKFDIHTDKSRNVQTDRHGSKIN